MAGADYNIFLSPKSNSDRHQKSQSKEANDYEANGADYNVFLNQKRNFDKFGVEKKTKEAEGQVGSDYNAFLSEKNNFDKFGVEKYGK